MTAKTRPPNSTNKPDGFDIIGDLHGHADKLIKLLETMGYTHNGDHYRHPYRQAIFLGDFIDRGPQQKLTLDTVMPMVQNDAALAVMGNHELNALAFHTEHPDKPGTWLRPRNNKNTAQHLEFLQEYIKGPGKNELDDVLAFFHSLPLWLDLGELRIIHAAWHPELIDKVQPHLLPGNRLDSSALVKATDKNGELYRPVETLLKGIEYPLPDGVSFRDKDDVERYEVRCWFFRSDGETIGDVMLHTKMDDQSRQRLNDTPIEEGFIPGYPAAAPPVFVGHYWMGESDHTQPQALTSNVACLDYSAGKGGDLVGYRWSGESTLNNANFISV